MREVAKAAGTSLSTVSAVLSNSDKYVSEGQRKKVLDAAQALGYSIPPKKRFSQKTIAVILPVVTSSFFSNVFNGIEGAISQNENLLLYYNSNYDFDKERACLKTLRKQSLTGIILNSICPIELECEYIQWIKREFIHNGIPVVLLERKIEDDGFYSIYIDNFNSAQAATKHLLQCGHTKIAHIAGNDRMIHSQDRLKGYSAALTDYGIGFDPELVGRGDFTPYSGYVAMKRLLDVRADFTALFSANDQMAVGAIKAIKALGKQVPGDIAVVGFDNLSVSSLIDPALTTVNVPTYQMGRTAAKIILDASEGCAVQNTYEIATNLIVRKSSDITATNEWELQGW